jgi:triacylglycerol lipase
MPAHPVLLVHGIDDTVARLRHLQTHLEDSGLSVHSFNLVPNDGETEIAELAQQLAAYIRANFTAGEGIDLVGFSMGGLVSRVYIQRLGGIHRVRKFISIGTPHRGTWTAYLRNNPGARDMRWGSAFLVDLNRDIAMLGALSFTSIWTPLDLMVLPANSSFVPVGRSVRVPSLAHPFLVRDRRVLKLVLRILSE